MKTLFYSFFICIVLLLNSNITNADNGKSLKFRVHLSGAQEVTPPAPVNGVETNTTGKLQIIFNKSLSRAFFRLRIFDGIGITQVHLHCGRAGENGPVAVFLFGLEENGVDVDGTLARGTLVNNDISSINPDCEAAIGRQVNNMASLALAAQEGLIYANVHSLAYPPGELRGQLFLD